MDDRYILINDLDAPEVRLYTKLNERQVSRAFAPDDGAFICESIRVIGRALEAGYEPLSFFIEEGMADEVSLLQAGMDFPVYMAPHEVMKEITGYSLTGGVLAAMRRKPLISIGDFVSSHRQIAVLDDIENPTNVGAIFRSAAALGADGILLTKGCADPLYRRAARVSMGTVFQTDWTFADAGEITPYLKNAGFESFALALNEHAEILGKISLAGEKTAVILGNEDHGISRELLSGCDHMVVIPMMQGVDSLNVAAASAVAFWELWRITDMSDNIQWKK